MDDATLAARQAASQRAFYAAITPTMPAGCVLRLGGGVQAAIAPAVASHPLFNAVVYDEPGALLEQLGGIDDAYRAAGIEAWMVWVRPGHGEVARALEVAGHALDGSRQLMAGELDAMDLAPRAEPDLGLDVHGTWDEIAAVNDVAHAVTPERSFRAATARLHNVPTRGWIARVGAQPASVMVTNVHDGDCYVFGAATLPELRGRRLATELLRRALRTAHEEGAQTTTLEARLLAAQLDARLGYRVLGELQMWERRFAA
jgi:ribosomal protein S18 acetylase RimI-like enzyme